jgi:hypothetical protein
MPYEVSFTKRVEVSDPDQYINECCYGGDVVSDQLLPILQRQYTEMQHLQEDWGWFLWFRRGRIRLAVDIFCDDPDQGAFRMHLTSRTPGFLFGDKIEDTPELDELRDTVVSRLTEWVGQPPRVVVVDEGYSPKASAT